MERDTKTVKTPVDKHEVVLKTWITGKEKRDLRRPFLDGMKFGAEPGGQAKMSEMKAGDVMEKAENMALETIIVSINGKSEDVVNRVLEMKDKDYDFIVAEVNKVTQEENFPNS